MTPLTYVVMYGFVPFALWLFGKYPPRVAVAAVFVVGWCFLPQAEFIFPVIPDYTKVSALGIAAIWGVYAKDPKILSTFKFGAIDLPMAAWCIAPFFSSVTNDLGAWDGFSAILQQVFEWGIPYFVGRLYFGELEAMKILGIAMFVGALVLAPLALIEIVISPQLHIILYGWYPHDFSQTKRGGGYRPSIFMHHGLELAIWMMAGLFLGWQLFLQKVIPKMVPILKVPTFPAVLFLTFVTVACRSSGALMLFFFAMGVFMASKIMRFALPFYILLAIPVIYMNLRATGAWDGQSFVDAAERAVGTERSESLAYRIHNETILAEKAGQRRMFGWSGYRRSFVTNDEGEYISVPDGMWILTFGKNGLFGLTALTATLLLAPFLFTLKWPAKTWGDPLVAPAAAFAVILGVTMIDDLLNAMYNPVMMLAAGGLSSLVSRPQRVMSSADLARLEVGGTAPILPTLPATRVI